MQIIGPELRACNGSVEAAQRTGGLCIIGGPQVEVGSCRICRRREFQSEVGWCAELTDPRTTGRQCRIAWKARRGNDQEGGRQASFTA